MGGIMRLVIELLIIVVTILSFSLEKLSRLIGWLKKIKG